MAPLSWAVRQLGDKLTVGSFQVVRAQLHAPQHRHSPTAQPHQRLSPVAATPNAPPRSCPGAPRAKGSPAKQARCVSLQGPPSGRDVRHGAPKQPDELQTGHTHTSERRTQPTCNVKLPPVPCSPTYLTNQRHPAAGRAHCEIQAHDDTSSQKKTRLHRQLNNSHPRLDVTRSPPPPPSSSLVRLSPTAPRPSLAPTSHLPPPTCHLLPAILPPDSRPSHTGSHLHASIPAAVPRFKPATPRRNHPIDSSRSPRDVRLPPSTNHIYIQCERERERKKKEI